MARANMLKGCCTMGMPDQSSGRRAFRTASPRAPAEAPGPASYPVPSEVKRSYDDLGQAPAFHLLVDSASAEYVWDCLMDAMAEFDGRPAGLNALAGLPLAR